VNGASSAIRRRLRTIGSEDGFTLIELLVVIVMIGITTAMFETTFGIVINRSSQVQAQNILQTEVRAEVNQLVTDLRNSTVGDASSPIISYSDSEVKFYSPDRLAPNKMRIVRYFLEGNKLKRQVAMSTNSNGPPWTGIDPATNAGPIVSSMSAPLSGDTTKGGWAAGQIFKYCIQSPPDMTIDSSNSTSPELITWSCKKPTIATDVKTVVVRVVVSANSSSEQFNYGAVATVRWNAS
jgi:prepilin-type N-terminal cleavage/methylation domain-containing protein